jgi:two-component system, chemotaxis family, protein-glutamate methylesterase/glutaminase
MSQAERRVIRVLVVEDSPVAAEFLTHLLNSDMRIRVAAVASDGEQAVEMTRRVRPDVITMDIHMPKVDGLEATRSIMQTCPAPIVIVSGAASTDEMALHFRAMEAGALAVVARPSGADKLDAGAAKQLLETVKLMSEVKVVKRWARARYAGPAEVPTEVTLPAATRTPQAVVIGASTGGPLALQTLLCGLPKDFPLPVLIVQHMTPGFAGGFVEWLGNSSGFPVRVAEQGEALLAGRAYIAPDEFHMGVRGNRIRLSGDAKENGLRPSVSYLFRSAKEAFRSEVIGILLTGMGRDGALELKHLKDAGAITIAQDEASSVVHGMPREAIACGGAGHVLPPEAIATLLASIARKP